MADPKDSGVLRERSEDGKRGYRDGVRGALRVVEGCSSLEEARGQLARLVEFWEESGDVP